MLLFPLSLLERIQWIVLERPPNIPPSRSLWWHADIRHVSPLRALSSWCGSYFHVFISCYLGFLWRISWTRCDIRASFKNTVWCKEALHTPPTPASHIGGFLSGGGGTVPSWEQTVLCSYSEVGESSWKRAAKAGSRNNRRWRKLPIVFLNLSC